MDNRFPKLAHNMPRNLPFCSFTSFLYVSIAHCFRFFQRFNYFHNIFHSLFKTNNIVVPEPELFLRISGSAVDVAANPNGIKTLLANTVSTFFIIGKPIFSNGPRSLPWNPHDCINLEN